MGNRDVSAAQEYHNATKHSYWSVRSGHGLDWPNQPLPFKIYKDVDSVRLPTDGSPIAASVAETVGAEPLAHDKDAEPDLGTLARLLYLSAGITKRKPYAGGELYFRAAACTGALYHIDLYLVCGDLPGLDAGVYHFGPNDFGLVRLTGGRLPGCAGGCLGPREVHSRSSGYACACGYTLAERLEVRGAGVQARFLGCGDFAG